MKKEVQLTAKSLTIDDLKNTDHVGFITKYYGKGCVAPNERYKLFLTAINNTDTDKRTPVSTFHDKSFSDMEDVVNHLCGTWKVLELFVFDTRKELYQWLAED